MSLLTRLISFSTLLSVVAGVNFVIPNDKLSIEMKIDSVYWSTRETQIKRPIENRQHQNESRICSRCYVCLLFSVFFFGKRWLSAVACRFFLLNCVQFFFRQIHNVIKVIAFEHHIYFDFWFFPRCVLAGLLYVQRQMESIFTEILLAITNSMVYPSAIYLPVSNYIAHFLSQ